jgi:hypothetical protein
MISFFNHYLCIASTSILGTYRRGRRAVTNTLSIGRPWLQTTTNERGNSLLKTSNNANFDVSTYGLSKITANVLSLGAVADFGTQNCQCTTKADAR